MKKVSILMPTYNDADYIIKTIESVMKQNYSNWELLICDDGSTDNTKEVITKYKKKYDKQNRIKYFYQENADQLNALIHLIPKITGDYVYILHSDDLLYSYSVLRDAVDYMEKNKLYDAIISDLVVINKNGNVTGNQKVEKYLCNNRIFALQLLWLGRNFYNDFPFIRTKVFKNEMYNNYLIWNGPFWLDLDNNKLLNVKKVNFPIRKYRIYDENYLSSEGANFNVINGEIRVVTRLLNNYSIPFYRLQYLIYRAFNKLKIGLYYPVVYKKSESNNKYKIIKYVLNKRFSDKQIRNNLFLNSLLLFYRNNKKREIYIDNIDENTVWYYGKDMRIFNKKILDNNIEALYKNILKEMELGFNKIVIYDKKYYTEVVDLTKFLCIYPYVKVIVRSKKNDKR